MNTLWNFKPLAALSISTMQNVSKVSNAFGKLVIRLPPEEASTSRCAKSSAPVFADYLQHKQAEQ